MKLNKYLIATSLSAVVLTSCSGLSSRAKEMIGDYYVPAISADGPVMELKEDGSCVMHAYGKDNVLTYEVPGKWNVVDEVLEMDLEPEKITFTGDSSLIGNIPEHISKKVVEFNGLTLTLNVDGINYTYNRRGHIVEEEMKEKQRQQATEEAK